MDSNEALNAYRALSVKYHPDQWTVPDDVAGHLERLRAMVEDGTADDYPGPFVYHRQSLPAYASDWRDLLGELGRADLDPAIRERVLREVETKLARAAVLAREDDAGYAAAQRDTVGLPTDAFVATGRAILDGVWSAVPFPVRPDEPAADPSVSSADLVSRVRAALDAYGLGDWQALEYPSMTAKASVNGPQRRVRIRTGARFTPQAADRLLAHEVGGHVLRWANSQDQPEGWVSVPLGQTVPTEEGMAAWREVEFGVQSADQVRVYAARVVAVDAAQRLGLVGVARLLQPYVGGADAAEIALRTKRGLLNPNAPGGPTKDWGYLAGLWQMTHPPPVAPDLIRGLWPPPRRPPQVILGCDTPVGVKLSRFQPQKDPFRVKD